MKFFQTNSQFEAVQFLGGSDQPEQAFSDLPEWLVQKLESDDITFTHHQINIKNFTLNDQGIKGDYIRLLSDNTSCTVRKEVFERHYQQIIES